MPNETTFYLHIPKTGGQTLATRLASAFPAGMADIIGEDLVYPSGVEQLRYLLNEKKFVERHVAGPVMAEFPGLDILTTVREPVSHIVSNYLHIRREERNSLHRAASMLSPGEFFARFGDLLADRQSRYLVSAFFGQEIGPDPLKMLACRMFDAIGRIRWVVPTDSIDIFTSLWEMESRRHLHNGSIRVNVARKDAAYGELLGIVRDMPELYSVDMILWQAARSRFPEYKEKVQRSLMPSDVPDNAGLAYRSGDFSVWLRRGWHLPQAGTPVGTAWWSGPENFSEVVFRRRRDMRYLKLTIAVVCGVPHSRIIALRADRSTRIPAFVRQIGSNWEYWIDLDGLSDNDTFWLWVPQVCAPVMVDCTTEDMERKAFATCDWGLVCDMPSDGDVFVVGNDPMFYSKLNMLE